MYFANLSLRYLSFFLFFNLLELKWISHIATRGPKLHLFSQKNEILEKFLMFLAGGGKLLWGNWHLCKNFLMFLKSCVCRRRLSLQTNFCFPFISFKAVSLITTKDIRGKGFHLFLLNPLSKSYFSFLFFLFFPSLKFCKLFFSTLF